MPDSDQYQESIDHLRRRIDEEHIQALDLKYIGLDGLWYHITVPSHRLEHIFQNGVPFDGSSIPGMRAVESGDMILIPDPASVNRDPFTDVPTLRLICSIGDVDNRVGVKKDPRSVAQRAQQFISESGIADEILVTPELEFYLFDQVKYGNSIHESGYYITSAEDKHILPHNIDDLNAISQQDRKGYHMDSPFDRYYALRQQIVDTIESMGIHVRYHHHEVGLAGQQEIETELLPFPKICDDIMIMKDIVRKSALAAEKTATFMPKPLFDQAGSGMHFHLQPRKDGKNICYKKGGYADLSAEALWFIGGILKHGRSLTALTNPSTNSYKRLLPGFEAPVKLFFGLANRSAAIRIPKYATQPESKRFEFRTGDGLCNPYLALSALIMAGLDGVRNRIHPHDHNMGPYDDNIFNWSDEQKSQLTSIPDNLESALEALEKDHDYLLKEDVFNHDLITSYIELKRIDVEEIRRRPHPYEMTMYYNV